MADYQRLAAVHIRLYVICLTLEYRLDSINYRKPSRICRSGQHQRILLPCYGNIRADKWIRNLTSSALCPDLRVENGDRIYAEPLLIYTFGTISQRSMEIHIHVSQGFGI